jgi:hypothetical protein
VSLEYDVKKEVESQSPNVHAGKRLAKGNAMLAETVVAVSEGIERTLDDPSYGCISPRSSM